MLPIATMSHDNPIARATECPPIRALLLDDNRFDQRRIERLARDSGLMITVDVAANLATMAELLDLRDYDVALLDYRLPVGSGRDAIKLLREHQANHKCAAIMVAGDDFLDEAAQAMRAACDTYISKDELTAELLRSSVNSILNDRAMGKSKAVWNEGSQLQEWQVEVEASVEGLIREIRHLNSMRQSQKVDLSQSLSRLERRAIKLWSDIRRKGAEIIGQDNKFDVLVDSPPQSGRTH